MLDVSYWVADGLEECMWYETCFEILGITRNNGVALWHSFPSLPLLQTLALVTVLQSILWHRLESRDGVEHEPTDLPRR